MEEKELTTLLSELAKHTVEPVRHDLAEEIKQHIPMRLAPYRRGIHTISIIIDLRVSRLAAALIVVASMVLLAGLLGSRNSTDEGILKEGKMLAQYLLGAGGKNQVSMVESMREYFAERGENFVFYAERSSSQDSNSLLMHWKVSDGRYKVVFGDFRIQDVNADELIKLQTQMLQKK
jgi:hypothetical protein